MCDEINARRCAEQITCPDNKAHVDVFLNGGAVVTVCEGCFEEPQVS